MGLAHRVIPTVLCRGRQLVKGRQFAANRVVGHAAQAVHIHNQRGVDELVLLDIGATPEGRGPDLDLVRELSEACFMPLAVGGGVRSVDDVRALLNAGADKVVIGTAIAEQPLVLPECALRFGSQAIVAAIDYRTVNQADWNAPRPCVAVRAGKTALAITNDDSHTPMHPVEYAQLCERGGAGEILLTSIDREGTLQGYDLDLVRAVSEAVSIPVVANGGCSDAEDMVAAIRAGASACAAGALFQFSDVTPRDCARHLAAAGIEARL